MSNCGSASVRVFARTEEMGAAAADQAASILIHAITERQQARLIVATGPSQEPLIGPLVQRSDVHWRKAVVFHMDEYVGIDRDHPASFRRWLRTRVADVVEPRAVHYLDADASDPEAEAERYARLLEENPIDLCLVGFGENGHIAFNDPSSADFRDPQTVKRVRLEERCRLQQVGEGHFPGLEQVPEEALTITCRTIMKCSNLICFVPARRKAKAVYDALIGPISIDCPASIVRTHHSASIYLDANSASQLPAFNTPIEARE